MHGETVTRLRSRKMADKYSADFDATDTDYPDEEDVPDVLVALAGTTESLEAGRTQVEADYELFGPAGWDITTEDQVRVRGTVCDVVGLPFDWRLGSWTPGTAIRVKLQEG